MSKAFVIRIRGPTGMWRVNNLNSKGTIKNVMEDIQKTKGIPLKDQSISRPVLQSKYNPATH